MNAVAMAQVKWSSIWQCMNHTPAIEKIHNITPNLIVILRKIISLVCRLAVSRVYFYFYFYFLIKDMSACNIPGLEASNLIATQPFLGTEMVF